MSVPYDVFTDAFLSKITEYDFVNMRDFERNSLIDGYMKNGQLRPSERFASTTYPQLAMTSFESLM